MNKLARSGDPARSLTEKGLRVLRDVVAVDRKVQMRLVGQLQHRGLAHDAELLPARDLVPGRDGDVLRKIRVVSACSTVTVQPSRSS